MKANRMISCISLALALPACALTIYVSMTAQSRPAKLLWSEPGARAAASNLVESLSSGDFRQGSAYLLGNPELTVPEEGGSDAQSLLWDYYRTHLTGGLIGEPYLSIQGYCQDAVFYVPDLDSLTQRMKERAPELMTERIVSARELSEVYNEDFSLRQDVVDQILAESAYTAMGEAPGLRECHTRLRLVYEGGRWLIRPDQGLLDILAGNMESRA